MSSQRTQIYLSEKQRSSLKEITDRDQKTLAAVVREALDAYMVGGASAGQEHPPVTTGVTPLLGDNTLLEQFVALRRRRGLVRIQAIWGEDYDADDVDQYFVEEDRWLSLPENASVTIERLVARSVADQPRHRARLQWLADRHEQLTLFLCEPNPSFAVYLAEYNLPNQGRSLAGILIVLNKLSKVREFGILLDGQVNGALNGYLYTLRAWFEGLQRTEITPRSHQTDTNIWNKNARAWDSFFSPDAKLPFIREYIRQEDAYLVNHLSNSAAKLSFIEFGSGTGRAIEMLQRDKGAAQVVNFIGLDSSRGMHQEAHRKRAAAASSLSGHTYYFALDASESVRHFWNGRIYLGDGIGDGEQLKLRPLDESDYAREGRLICCLLNTLGVIEPSQRRAFVSNMFLAASHDDDVILSMFDGMAFEQFARPLYHHIQELTFADVTEACFNNATRTFRAGYYYSHWMTDGEIRELVDDAGGRVVDVHAIEFEGVVIGNILRCRRKPDHF